LVWKSAGRRSIRSPSFFVGYIKKFISNMSLKRFKEFIFESEEEKTYSFDELPKEVKEKALENNRYINVEYTEWYEPVVEDFEYAMEELGLKDVEVEFTGFYSQGDGASFTARVDDVELFLKKALEINASTEFLDMGEDEDSSKEADELRQLMGDLRNVGYDTREKLKPEDLYLEIVRITNRYSHENTIEASVEMEELDVEDDDRDWNKFYDEMMSMITDWAREESKELYQRLNKYYDELQSDEEVAETLIANDYQFNEEGEIV